MLTLPHMTHLTRKLIFEEILLNFHIVNSLEVKGLNKKTMNLNKQTNRILILPVQIHLQIYVIHTYKPCAEQSPMLYIIYYKA